MKDIMGRLRGRPGSALRGFLVKTAVSLVLVAGATACTGPERLSTIESVNTADACDLMRYGGHHWEDALADVRDRYNVDPAAVLAIMKRESSFRAQARPSRTYFLGVIPTGRRSSAYGYAQAIDGTWDWYRTERARPGARRNRFADAADFIGWYMSKSRDILGLSSNDLEEHYLAYHEGHGG